MKLHTILALVSCTIVSFACTALEDFEFYPEITDGSWRLSEVEFSTNPNRDSCSFDGVISFLPNGEYERQAVPCEEGQQIEDPIQGSWKFKEDGDILFVKERLIIETAAALIYRSYSYELAGDTLRLTESLDDGIDRFVYVRE